MPMDLGLRPDDCIQVYCGRVLWARVGTLNASVLSQQQPHQCLKDFGVPNSSWSPEMMDQFQKFTKLSEDGSWQRIPSYNNCVDSMPEGRQKRESQNGDRRFFVHSIDGEGLGFEYSVFMNPSEQRAVALFQPGPYLEGPLGFANGGAIVTILYQAVRASINLNARIANLNIDYKRPVALGSVALVEARVDRIEGGKVFLNFEVRSVDGQTLYSQGVGK
ncbi:acyl-coenzyme A thioesterase THEM4-like [Protobothrops mucrosquamatus]|uniref:acyl-coenzyme A thioesterase THEM4-like n=1 Tax=Protobothrops mucrosquamatus TaxID=103944 RepID=UPI000775DDA0|nr:acyl-coenzyme A thioesterase THEM4-like [Protobothrops mucrosquamatus]